MRSTTRRVGSLDSSNSRYHVTPLYNNIPTAYSKTRGYTSVSGAFYICICENLAWGGGKKKKWLP